MSDEVTWEINRTAYRGCHAAVNYVPEQPVKRDGLVIQAIRLSDKRSR